MNMRFMALVGLLLMVFSATEVNAQQASISSYTEFVSVVKRSAQDLSSVKDVEARRKMVTKRILTPGLSIPDPVVARNIQAWRWELAKKLPALSRNHSELVNYLDHVDTRIGELAVKKGGEAPPPLAVSPPSGRDSIIVRETLRRDSIVVREIIQPKIVHEKKSWTRHWPLVLATLAAGAGICELAGCFDGAPKASVDRETNICIKINSENHCPTPSTSALSRQRSFGASIPVSIFR